MHEARGCVDCLYKTCGPCFEYNFRLGRNSIEIQNSDFRTINQQKQATAWRFWSDKISVSHRGRSKRVFVVGALLFPCVSFLSHTMRALCIYRLGMKRIVCATHPCILFFTFFAPPRLHPAAAVAPWRGCCACSYFSHQRPSIYLSLCGSAAPPALRNACMHSYPSSLHGSGRDNNRIFIFWSPLARARPGCYKALFVRARSRFFLPKEAARLITKEKHLRAGL